ncbi:hypothetical protein HOE425_40017 [Hoeflea sp. EC-HK425]|nr:hypothetical protein HOE425_40017 [Hoeflea sp. EC-HK425]
MPFPIKSVMETVYMPWDLEPNALVLPS